MSVWTWLRLFQGLGPWTPLTTIPEAKTERCQVDLGSDGEMELRVWGPSRGRPRGALFVIPGLHFQGPDHPRLDRLARICARAGLLVGSPALPDFLEMRVRPRSGDHAQAAFAAFCQHPRMPNTRPGLMSVSFGAYPALRVASSDAHRERVGGILCFGGYLNWRVPIRYSWNDHDGVPFDIRNNPVAYTFLLNALPPVSNPTSVEQAWDAYIRETWGSDEQECPEACRRLALELAADLDEPERRLFLQGCRFEEGALQQLEEALETIEGMDWLDVGPMLKSLRNPLIAVHSLDDEISPPSQSKALVEACPAHIDARLYLTGIYGHSGQLAEGGKGLGLMIKELFNFGRIVSSIVEISTVKGSHSSDR
jgi:hypothetical protein